MRRLVEFSWSMRGGCLEGRFVVDELGWAKLHALIDDRTELYFGEVMGKHSEVWGILEEKDITVVTESQEFLALAYRLGINLETGYNPLDYVREDDEDEECEGYAEGEDA